MIARCRNRCWLNTATNISRHASVMSVASQRKYKTTSRGNTPRGAFYIFPNIAALFGRRAKGQPLTTAAAVADYLLEAAGVAVVPHYDALFHEVIKIVGTSTDLDAVARCEASIQREFGTRVTAARSQPYYLDVTHPDANKGAIVRRLARYLNVSPRRVATIGDQMNDTLMFRESGLSIAMGNASPEVQRQATFVTTSFGEEGFANAVDRFILPRTQLSKTT